MKKYFIVLFILIACNLTGYDFTFTWDFNPDTDLVDRYYVYPIVTIDSVEIPFDSTNFWMSFNHDSLKAINPDSASIIYPSNIDNNYLQFRVRARNIKGFGLPSDASNILRKTPMPETLSIQKI